MRRRDCLKALLLAGGLFSLSACNDEASPGPGLREQAAQLLIVGFRGTDLGSSGAILSDIREHRIGGVILFDRDVALKSTRNIVNPEQLRALVSGLQSAAGQRLLVAIDQEGGMVNRLKPVYGFAPTHTARYFGERNEVGATLAEAEQTAAVLRYLGINLNFAPVVDLDINPDSPAIGRYQRSYSADPDVVERHAGAVIDAHRAQAVATALKHFPGHGSATEDSHAGFTDVTNTWQAVELEPYRRFIRDGRARVVMSAHVFHAGIDPVYPATLSPAFIDGLLRRELGFDGVVVSDDMQMGAITQYFGLEHTIEQALNAGVDMLVFGNNLNYQPQVAGEAIDLIEKLVHEGRVAPERVRQAYERVCRLKREVGLSGC